MKYLFLILLVAFSPTHATSRAPSWKAVNPYIKFSAKACGGAIVGISMGKQLISAMKKGVPFLLEQYKARYKPRDYYNENVGGKKENHVCSMLYYSTGVLVGSYVALLAVADLKK